MKKPQQTSIFGKEAPNLRSIKAQIDQLSNDPSIKSGLRFGFLSLGFCLLILAIRWHRLPPELPLLYSLPYGQERLIPSWQIWFLPLLGLIIQLIAVRGSGEVIENDRLLAQILVWSATIIAIMILVTLIKTILLVT
jgi:hypothetical protein